jgi:hypothetical protein
MIDFLCKHAWVSSKGVPQLNKVTVWMEKEQQTGHQ